MQRLYFRQVSILLAYKQCNTSRLGRGSDVGVTSRVAAPTRPVASAPTGRVKVVAATLDRAEVGLGAARVIVLIPAHNEADCLADALDSVFAQTRAVDHVIVVSDNSTDATVDIARSYGVTVLETVGNTAKKAGALNQAIEWLFGFDAAHRALTSPDGGHPRRGSAAPCDALLIMDADGTINDTFVANALDVLATQPAVGGVGGVFAGRDGGGLLGLLQRMEYARYARQIGRRRARASVLTGTGTLFRASAIADVASSRALGDLPARGAVASARVYAQEALTEDNELTLALKRRGWSCVSPRGCVVTTDVMPTVSALFHQRVRWYRGALEDLLAYGLNATTLPYLGQQLSLLFSIFVFQLFIALTVTQSIIDGGLTIRPLWLSITIIFAAEQFASARRVGWRGGTLAALLLPVMLYDLLLQFFYLSGWGKALRRAERVWVPT